MALVTPLVSMSVRFRGGVRLRVRAEFTSVQERGRRVATRYLTVLAMPNALDRDRLGIIASRRFGGAVVRNRAKRLIREAFRAGHPDTAASRRIAPLDVVVIPRRECVTASLQDVRQDLQTALGRLDRSRGR